jgi:hypothetical protein
MSLLAHVLVAPALLLLAHASAARGAGAYAGAPSAGPAGNGPLWDDGAMLPARARVELEARLRAAARQTGIPITILVVAKLPGGPSIADVARSEFDARGLGTRAADAVLLAIAPRERRAAIETGKGPAGIIPEIDAEAIIARLRATVRSPLPIRELDAAIDRIVASVTATIERRRPLPHEPTPAQAVPPAALLPSGTPPGSDEDQGGGDGSPASGATRPGATGTGTSPSRGRSLLPTAVAVSGLLLVGLALRQRRRSGAAERDDPEPPVRSRRLP